MHTCIPYITCNGRLPFQLRPPCVVIRLGFNQPTPSRSLSPYRKKIHRWEEDFLGPGHVWNNIPAGAWCCLTLSWKWWSAGSMQVMQYARSRWVTELRDSEGESLDFCFLRSWMGEALRDRTSVSVCGDIHNNFWHSRPFADAHMLEVLCVYLKHKTNMAVSVTQTTCAFTYGRAPGAIEAGALGKMRCEIVTYFKMPPIWVR